MSQWNQKFKYNLPGSFSYHLEYNPLYLKYLLTSKGFACPDFNHCLEIGCGKGLSILPHALTQSSHWMGQEFNPSLVHAAKRSAATCHIQVDLTSESLEQLVSRTDLPKFDLICVHGVWSWVSKQDQELLIDLAHKHLNDGGIFYISYNCKVGLGNFAPIRNLINLFNEHKCPRNLSNERKLIEISKFLFPIIKLNPSFAIAQQDFGQFMQNAMSNPEPFLSDSLNSYWSCDHFAEVASRLERADLGYVCSACGVDNLDIINLTSEQSEFLQPLQGTDMYEETRDFMVNRRVRNDIFIKGAIALSNDEFIEEFSAQNLILSAPVTDFDYKMIGNAGEMELDPRVYAPLMAILTDYCPHNIGQIVDAIIQNDPELQLTDIIVALNILVFAGVCAPAVSNAQITEDMVRLNLSLINNFGEQDTVSLCSPIIQGALNVDPIQARLLRTYINTPNCTDKELIEALLTAVVQGEISLSADEDEQSDEELIATVHSTIHEFNQTFLPFISKLMVL